jgi:signal transduction histidine kinase
VLEERERIAMDLHDGIIQSILPSATIDSGQVTLQNDRRQASGGDGEAIDRLNEGDSGYWAYIIDLQPSRVSMDNLEAALGRLGPRVSCQHPWSSRCWRIHVATN